MTRRNSRCADVGSVRKLARCGFAFAITLATILTAGCGSDGDGGSAFHGNTTVVVMASSTANDQLSGFEANIQGLTLTDEKGQQQTLIATAMNEEFIHLNGTVEPLATVSIPQGGYVSAAITLGSANPLCVGQVPGELYGDEMANSRMVTVNLPSPITVTGNVMGLVLNLDVSESTPFTGACPTSLATVAPSDTAFSLTPMNISAQPTSSANGKALGLRGIIGSVAAGGAGFTVNSLSSFAGMDPPSWTVAVNGMTTLQSGLSSAQLVPGALVDMDAAVQQDGSLLATRIALIETNLANLTVVEGPVMEVSAAEPVILFEGTAQEGYFAPNLGYSLYYNFGNATFEVSSQPTNLATLPFPAGFSAASMVAGQRMAISTQATTFQGGPNYFPLTRVTLLPQTIDGTVSAISTVGNFTTYTVQLASYDWFPAFAVEPGQTTQLTAPDTVVVYADSNTQMLNSGSVGVGSVARFYGLIFNDSGTLRMDCSQVNDGVPE